MRIITCAFGSGFLFALSLHARKRRCVAVSLARPLTADAARQLSTQHHPLLRAVHERERVCVFTLVNMHKHTHSHTQTHSYIYGVHNSQHVWHPFFKGTRACSVAVARAHRTLHTLYGRIYGVYTLYF